MKKNVLGFILYIILLMLMQSSYAMEIEELFDNGHRVDFFDENSPICGEPFVWSDFQKDSTLPPSPLVESSVAHQEKLSIVPLMSEPDHVPLMCPWCRKVVGERASTMKNVITCFRVHARKEHADKTAHECNVVIKNKFPTHKIRARGLTEIAKEPDEALYSEDNEEPYYKRKKSTDSEDLSITCPYCPQIVGKNITVVTKKVSAIRRHISRKHPNMTREANDLFIKEKFPQYKLRSRREDVVWLFSIECSKCPRDANVFGSDHSPSHAISALKYHWQNRHMDSMDEFSACVLSRFPDHRFNSRTSEKEYHLTCHCGQKYASDNGVQAVVGRLRAHFRENHPGEVEGFSEIVEARYPHYRIRDE